MKILHTADWHLGMDLHKMSLLEDQKDALLQLKTIILEEQIDVVVVAGDIYDTTLASKEAIELYNMVMTMLCMELKKTVILIAGNHDSAVRLSTCSSLLAKMGLHIYGGLDKKVEGQRIEDTMFYPIPYLHPKQVANVYGQPAETQEEAFRIICEDLRKTMDPALHHIVVAHAFIAGASVCESDRFACVGGSDLVSSKVLEGFDYVALGHLHRTQKVAEHIWYSGSLLPYSFSETDDVKSVILYDTDTNEISFRKLQPLHPLYLLKGTFAQLQEGRMKDDGYPDGYVKLDVSDQSVTYEMLQYFQQHYPGLLQLSGKHEQLDSHSSIHVEELEELDDISIVRRFFQDMFEEEVSKEELDLFQEALHAFEEV